MPANGDTAERVLDVAEQLVQLRGYNGFSYADVAAELGITKASLHYHFPGKGELGRALIDRYAERFMLALVQIERAGTSPREMLVAYARLYGGALTGHRMCLCGMLAAEYQTLPEQMRDAVVGFFDENEAWLERVLEDGRRDAALSFGGSAREAAQMIISGLEGAMLITRPYGDARRFETTAAGLLAGLTAD